MAEDATSESTDTNADASATEDDTAQAQQMLADAIEADGEKDTAEKHTAKAGPSKAAAATADADTKDDLGDAGKRALLEERKARRDAEKQLKDMSERLKGFVDRDKTDLQRAIDRAEAAEQGATSMRVANARLMAAATHNLPPDLIDLLGDGTDEEIDERAKKLAAYAAAASQQQDTKPTVTRTRPVESLTAGAKPSGDRPSDPNDFLRQLAARARH